MGLFKKLAEKASAGAPDYPGVIGKLLPPGECLVGWGHADQLAPVTDRNTRRHSAIGMAMNIASQKVSEHRHLAGEMGSAAMSIPRDVNGQLTVAITDRRLTFWSFGPMMRDVPPVALASFPLGDVRWIAKTGARDQYGVVVRFSFADESFIDFSVMEHEMFASFFSAAADVGR
jgi:hypothetical protein